MKSAIRDDNPGIVAYFIRFCDGATFLLHDIFTMWHFYYMTF